MFWTKKLSDRIVWDAAAPLEPGMAYPVKGPLTFEALREIEHRLDLAYFMRKPTRDERFIHGKLD